MPNLTLKNTFLNESGNYVKIFRALPLSAKTIRPGDYITKSKKFAIEHAVTSAIYNDELFQITMKLVPSSHIEEADNPGEYKYIGPEIKIKPLLIVDEDGNVKRNSLKEDNVFTHEEQCKDKITPPFKIYDDLTNFDILVFKGVDPRYNLGKVETINLNDPNLLATQDHVCKHKIEEYQNSKIDELPIVVAFENGIKFIQDGHHKLSAQKFAGQKKAKAYIIPRNDSKEVLEEELIKKSDNIKYFQMGGSLPDNLYNRKNNKPSSDPGVGSGGKRTDSSKNLEKNRKKKEEQGKEWYQVNEGVSVTAIDGAIEAPPRYWDSNDSPRINKKSRKDKEEYFERLYLDMVGETENNLVGVYKTDPEFYRSKAIAQKNKNIPKSKPFYNKSKNTTEYAGTHKASGLEIHVVTNDSSLKRSKAIIDYITNNEAKRLSLKEIFFNEKKEKEKILFYHGTTIDLNPGDYILPPNVTGKVSEKGRKKNLNKIFFTKDLGSAKIYAGRARQSLGGEPAIYIIEPIGDVDVINSTPGTTVFAAPKAKVVKKL